ncbi:MAG TPA: helix-turn-helix domain-containing protein [Patescibacteria group bacterium]|nr:helix-turn-helix domain-containing protein [Patescibacteria group bacterium]
MPKDTSAVRSYFAKLGLEPEIADLYLILHAYGPQTITALARNAGVERTRVYRLLDKLTTTNLVETETQYKRVILRAAPIMNLQILLTEREQEVRSLQDELQVIHNSLNAPADQSHLTRVQFYRGPEGNKQMFWNQTKAKGEALCVLYETMQTRTNLAFFERWVRRCNELDLQFRGIISDHFLEDLQSWYGKHSNERVKNWDSRYISPEVFPITHSTITYDNVIAYYNWRGGEVFGVEIYNQEIADAQRRVFEMLWKQGLVVPDDLNWKKEDINPGKK